MNRTLLLIMLLMCAVVMAQKPKPANRVPSPDSVTAPETQSARWYYERAIIFHLREEDGRATIELYKAIEKQPDYTEANFFLGLLYKNRERWEDAANTLDRVVAGSDKLPPKNLCSRDESVRVDT